MNLSTIVVWLKGFLMKYQIVTSIQSLNKTVKSPLNSFLLQIMSLWNSIMRTIREKSIRIETAREVFEAKDEYFIRNGAILLEKQITCNQGRDVEPIKIFSAKEIQQATNNYDPNLILGSAIAMVYKGTLDDREVAIKVKNPLILQPIEKL
ncbi:calmodulin-binding receptor-like cytoplasmic kinase 2, partial [Fagus crenata]